MRFKATLATEQVALLYSLVNPMSRLASDHASASNRLMGGGGGTIMFLSPEVIKISTRGRGAGDSDGMICFSELATQGGIFLDQRIESISDNVILFEIDLSQLRSALQSILSGGGSRKGWAGRGGGPQQQQQQQDAAAMMLAAAAADNMSTTIMKLAKRNGGTMCPVPCLCLEATCMGSGGSIVVHHAIPVRLMRPAEMKYHIPPRISLPDVKLQLPLNRTLRSIVERLRTISPHVYLEGSMAGELTLHIENEGASIRTFLTKLEPMEEDCKETNGTEIAQCTLKVDTKKLLTSLQWQASFTNLSRSQICMVENEMLVFYVFFNPESLGFFTYYVPVHILADHGD